MGIDSLWCATLKAEIDIRAGEDMRNTLFPFGSLLE